MSVQNPVAGEMWLNNEDGDYLFITHREIKVIESMNIEWIWWNNLNCKYHDDSSLTWFLANCRKKNND